MDKERSHSGVEVPIPTLVAMVFAINTGLPPALSYMFRAEVEATLMMSPPSAAKPDRKVPEDERISIKFPV